MLKAYGKYRKVRNAAWQVLIDNSADALPVNVVKIAKDNEIMLLKNSEVQELREGEAGISVYDGSDWFIVYDDTLPLERKRYTVAHELEHIFLGHPLIAGFHRRANAKTLHPTEKEANSFAIRLLSPACVLWGLELRSFADIAAVCNIPSDIAQARAARMTELYKRGKFLTSPLEKKVFELFKPFVEQNKKPAPI